MYIHECNGIRLTNLLIHAGSVRFCQFCSFWFSFLLGYFLGLNWAACRAASRAGRRGSKVFLQSGRYGVMFGGNDRRVSHPLTGGGQVVGSHQFAFFAGSHIVKWLRPYRYPGLQGYAVQTGFSYSNYQWKMGFIGRTKKKSRRLVPSALDNLKLILAVNQAVRRLRFAPPGRTYQRPLERVPEAA